MAGGFVKLFSSILDSSIWAESAETRLLWLTMLAMSDADGIVRSSISGLANRARISREGCEAGLAILLAPDPESLTPDNEGRRIERTGAGWLILNYRKHREKGRSQERTPYLTGKKQESRARIGHSVNHRQPLSTTVNPKQPIAEAEAEAEAEKGVGSLPLPGPLDSEEFRQAWADWLAYRRESKLTAWKPVTVKAKLAELAAWGAERAVAAIRRSIANGWQGIFDRDETPRPGRASAITSGLSDSDRAALRAMGTRHAGA